jgi:8-oxo-dGTP pyrophosphatase MutT (NUDIX family)
MLSLAEVTTRLRARPARTVGEDGWRYAAVATVFREGDDGAELLFIRRAEHPKDPWSGQLGFPGGRAEPEDASLSDTAARETREELGLDLLADFATEVGPLDQLQARARQKIMPMAIHPHAWTLAQSPTLSPNYEVAEAFWTPLQHLIDPDRRLWFDAARTTVPYHFPAIDLGRPVPLWGLTHHMVHEVLHRLQLIDDVASRTTPRARV